MRWLPNLALAALAACVSPASEKQPEPVPAPDPIASADSPHIARKVRDRSRPLHVIVLHTNDVHGQVLPRPATWIRKEDPPLAGGLPRVAEYVARVRLEADDDTFVLLVDGGDWSQGTPEGSLEQGRAFVRALRRLDYDGMALGNHEFDHGVTPLIGLLEELQPPAVCANLVDRETGEPVAWIPPVRLVEVADLTVALVGLLTPETEVITHVDARTRVGFADPARALGRVRDSWDGPEVDWWLPLTHIGLEADMELAAAHPDLHLIVGGHSHRFLPRGVRSDGTLIVQAGSKASVVGRVDLWFAPETRELTRSEARLVELLEEPSPRGTELELACAELVTRSAARMDEVVGELAAGLTGTRDRYRSSTSGNLISAVTRQALDADVGIMNRGGIRKTLLPGPVTRRDLFELCPFDNYTVRFEMSREALFEMLKRAVEDRDHSGVEVDGIELVIDDGELVDVLRDGLPLASGETLGVAMNSFMASGGDGYLEPRLADALPRSEDPRYLRELLEDYFLAVHTHEPDGTNRYVEPR